MGSLGSRENIKSVPIFWITLTWLTGLSRPELHCLKQRDSASFLPTDTTESNGSLPNHQRDLFTQLQWYSRGER